MATDAAAPLEKILAGGEDRSMVHNHVTGVALLTAGLHVSAASECHSGSVSRSGRDAFHAGGVVERREPVLVLAVRLLHAVELHAVAVVAGRAAELVGVVNLQ